jgi:hypothetical protein
MNQPATITGKFSCIVRTTTDVFKIDRLNGRRCQPFLSGSFLLLGGERVTGSNQAKRSVIPIDRAWKGETRMSL